MMDKIYLIIIATLILKINFVYPEDKDRALENQYKRMMLHHQQEINQLKEIKSKIINGNLLGAKQNLLEIDTESQMINLIRYRYLAIIHFINGEYLEALKILRSPIFIGNIQYKKNCFLILQTLMFLHRTQELEKEYDVCYRNNYKYSLNDFFWIKSLIDFLSKDEAAIRSDSMIRKFMVNESSEEEVKIWLKLAIYLNREKSVLPMIENIHEDFFKDKKIRELLGFIYYRMNDKELAEKFLEGVSSANRENIMGNISMERKKFEIAYGYFQLALNKKNNSLNAVERSLPLSWILKKWDEGQTIALKLPQRAEKRVERASLLSAFNVKNGNFKMAKENLLKAERILYGDLPRELNILFAYVSLMLDDYDGFKKYSTAACRQYDALSCTNVLAVDLWPMLNKMIKGDRATYDDNEVTMETMKQAQRAETETETDIDRLDEDVYIDQKDIEELDNRLFQLKY
ncbi:MAG: hypothetical protein HQK49_18740 [Oligoflexia bacterium]|nr:hypothetical protein [Oligoflexia bacterium]